VPSQTLDEVRQLPLRTVVLSCVAAAAVAAIVAGLLFGSAEGGDDTSDGSVPLEEAGGSAVGQPVVADEYETFADGVSTGTTDLTSYEGTPLVVNFFASWCVPCVTEMPAFEEVHQAYGDEVAFVGLAVRNTIEEGQGIVDDTGVTYDLGRDPRGDILTALGGLNLPTTVLVAADGTVTSVNTGEVSASELTEMIDDQLLA
jgi:cytochrome c biogenesis protein CcmG, thiol:disulfide interchange protein DsbE